MRFSHRFWKYWGVTCRFVLRGAIFFHYFFHQSIHIPNYKAPRSDFNGFPHLFFTFFTGNPAFFLFFLRNSLFSPPSLRLFQHGRSLRLFLHGRLLFPNGATPSPTVLNGYPIPRQSRTVS
jgi:hypothetical protein